MTDKLKSGTKAWADRQRRHLHNSFAGHVGMMRQNLITIINSDSTTWSTKNIARQMLKDTELLGQSIKTRIDP